MQRTQNQILIILAVGCLIFLTNLGKARLWDRDEPRNAGCAVEMMQRGNLVVPIFNDELRPQKPVLLYWLIISAYQMFGVSEFAARFWSAILAIGAMFATYGIGRRLFNPVVAVYAAIILASSTMFVMAGRAATPDSLLVFCSTTALLIYVLGTFAPGKDQAGQPKLRQQNCYFPQQTTFVLGMYAIMGLAVLAKGPVGFVMPCAIIGMFMLIMRLPQVSNNTWNSRGWIARICVAVLRPFHPVHFLRTLWQMRPITLAATVLLIAGPWFLAVGLQTNWDWPEQFLLKENFQRATTSFENHSGGWFYYPVMLCVGFFPWSVFFGPVAVEIDRGITRRHNQSAAWIFLVCWIGVQVGLFTLAQTKLPSYVTPCYPALALLTGSFFQHLISGKTSTRATFQRLSFVTLIASGLLITVSMAIAGHYYLNGDTRLLWIGLIPVAAGAFGLWFFSKEQFTRAALATSLFSISFVFAVFSIGTIVVDSHRQGHIVLQKVNHRNSVAPSAVATFGCLESSWVYYLGQPVYELALHHANGPWGSHRQHNWLRKSWPNPEQFVATHPDGQIITTIQNLEELKRRLPKSFQVVESAPYFLKQDDLVLLQNVNLSPPTAPRLRFAENSDEATKSR